ncbi:MAG: DNA polymerase III subunit delta' [Endomicrobiales bacterium]
MSFKDIHHQQKVKEIIAGQLRSGRIPHAYLFLGQDGVGRRKTALELAKALNCQKNEGQKVIADPCDHCISCQKIAHGNHPDVQVINFAWQANLEGKELEKQKALKIDTIRALQHDVNLRPTEGRWKVYLIEPAEKITLDAANCLLKTLEEPPASTVIILLAKHRENLPATVVSRTQTVFFRPLPEKEVAQFVREQYGLTEQRSREIAQLSEGSLSAAGELAGEGEGAAASLWKQLREGGFSTAELLSLSQQHAKSAPELTAELLAEAKNDFRADPARFGPAVEALVASRGLLERNVNPQMVLDVLFLKLDKFARNEGGRQPGLF